MRSYGPRMTRRRSWRALMAGLQADAALAVTLAALWQLEVWAPALVPGVSAVDGQGVALSVAGMVMLLPLAARRRAPLCSCAVVMGGAVLAHVVGPSPEGLSEVAGMVVASYSVACYSDIRRAVVGLALVVLSVALSQGFTADDLAFGVLLFGGAWALGRTVRSARGRTRELESLTGELARERGENARLAVELERTRIARELHDVVAHAVSVMVVQAGGVRGLLGPTQHDERQALGVIESTGRQAMGELRRMVGMLRAPVEGDGLAPPPALSHVRALVQQVRDAGLPVELTVAGSPRPLSPGLELSAYRVVQEALTNTLKHAGPAHAEVSVRYGERALELDVRDDGAGPSRNGGGGHGLTGMRERVGLYGGQLDVGAQPSGGYRVFARFPLGSAR